MEKKQTAVQWLEEQFNNPNIPTNTFSQVLFNRAKEMIKEQIIEAYNQSWHDRMKPYKTADNYYNETFNK